MRILELKAGMDDATLQCAGLLVDAHKELNPDAWPVLSAAEREIEKYIDRPSNSRVLINSKDQVLGLVFASSTNDGKVLKINHIAVRPDHQKKALGRMLLNDIESQARATHVLTLYIEAPDNGGWSSLAKEDLYSDLPSKLVSFDSQTRHPGAFFLKCGFSLTGVIPDAVGDGLPVICFSRKISYEE